LDHRDPLEPGAISDLKEIRAILDRKVIKEIRDQPDHRATLDRKDLKDIKDLPARKEFRGPKAFRGLLDHKVFKVLV
jgi:hypothetical protein